MSTSKFEGLPAELKLLITDSVESTTDLLSLRRTCKALGPATTSTLVKRFNKVCVTASEASVKAFVAICAHVIQRKYITEVVYLADTYMSEYGETLSLIGPEGNQLLKTIVSSFKLLPNLTKVSYCQGVARDKLRNALNKTRITGRMKETFDWTAFKVATGVAGRKNVAGQSIEFAMGTVQLPALTYVNTAINHIAYKAVDGLENLTSIDLSIDESHGDAGGDWRWGYVLRHAKHLKHLRLASEGPEFVRDGFIAKFIGGSQYYPKLESLILERKVDHDLAAAEGNGGAPLSLDPAVLEYFLGRYSGSLRRLLLRNIVASDHYFLRGFPLSNLWGLPPPPGAFLEPLRPIFARMRLDSADVLLDVHKELQDDAEILKWWHEGMVLLSEKVATRQVSENERQGLSDNIRATLNFGPWLNGRVIEED